MTTDERLDLILSRLDKIDDKIDEIDERIDKLDARMDRLEDRMDKLDNKVDGLKYQVELNTLTVENTVNKAIKVLGEGYQMNAERFDKLDIEAVKNKADIALSLSQLTNERMDRLIDNLNKTA
ncbi:MAG: hypothetical protein PUF72_07230 [Clostridiales bacterium]|nr:hypothetical protein [Clostridiales bacterium]